MDGEDNKEEKTREVANIWMISFYSARAKRAGPESVRAVTSRQRPHRREWDYFLTRQSFLTKTAITREQKFKKSSPRWKMNRLQTGRRPKLGSQGKNRIFRPKTKILGPPKKRSLLSPNHVLATTGKSCSKKKVAFAQIIKGDNVIWGDFLG